MRLKSCMLMCSLFMASLASASNFASDSFKTKSGKELTITFIKHGSLMLTYDNHSIQVDPVSEYADYTTFPKADIILITHEHGDHLDPKAIQAVEKSDTEIIATENSQKKLGKGIRIPPSAIKRKRLPPPITPRPAGINITPATGIMAISSRSTN